MKQSLISAALAATFLTAPAIGTAQETDLAKRVEQFAGELEKVKAELAAQHGQVAAPQPAAPIQSTATTPPAISAPQAGYGEVNYNHPLRKASGSQTDLRRAVIGIQHRFDATPLWSIQSRWPPVESSAVG